MFSKGIGKLDVNKKKVFLDLAKISDNDYLLDYSEYTIGFWRSMILMNHSGKSSDGEVIEYNQSVKYTENIEKLPYIKSIIESDFNTKKIKLARIVTIKKNGLILPHIDYLTFKKPRIRLNIPIICNKMAISVEGTTAYNMRLGEIWNLDATKIHSAGNFSEEDRVSLIIDFDCETNKETIKDHDIMKYDKIPIITSRVNIMILTSVTY